ncbi:MAG TPA: sugar transferase [Flavipsychrobacter sp.]|nr:sugar transferase [Flavipsychrobacter sp.]
MVETLIAHSRETHEVKQPRQTKYQNVTNKRILLIGQAALSISHNIQKHGYATIIVNNVHEAKNILFIEFFSQNRPLPEAIICDTRVGEGVIRHLAGYVSTIKEFNSIPFILLENEKESTNNINIEAITGVDDVLYYNSPVIDLIDKVVLLKKYKNLRDKLPYQFSKSQKPRPTLDYIIGRSVDITLSVIFLILLSPILLLITIAIKLDSKGPVLYASPRAGKRYQVFKFYKFRTMIADADKKMDQIKHLNQYDVEDSNNGPVFIKINKDPRVTRLGRFLRNSSLDELPQLINVLIGDMSLVGNRPLPLYEASSLTIDEAAQRFLAPAGITGLWQIKKRGQPDMSVQQRINLDIDYANRHSFLYDMQILFNTPRKLIQKADV